MKPGIYVKTMRHPGITKLSHGRQKLNQLWPLSLLHSLLYLYYPIWRHWNSILSYTIRPATKSNYVLKKSLVTLQTSHNCPLLCQIDSDTPNAQNFFKLLIITIVCVSFYLFEWWIRYETCELSSETEYITLQSTTYVGFSNDLLYSIISSASISEYYMIAGSYPPSMWNFLKKN